MTELDRIRDQLRRSWEGPAWHGPSLREILDGVDWERARARPITTAHSIAELVPHITTWVHAVRRRTQGDWSPVSDDEDFPPAAPGPDEWADAVEALGAAVDALDQALAEADDGILARTDPQGGFTLLLHLDGVVQHNLYHAGQIAVLRKASGGEIG